METSREEYAFSNPHNHVNKTTCATPRRACCLGVKYTSPKGALLYHMLILAGVIAKVRYRVHNSTDVEGWTSKAPANPNSIHPEMVTMAGCHADSGIPRIIVT